MDEAPITPHAAPSFDGAGNLTYVGDDGRRYVVGLPPDQTAGPSDQLLALLARGSSLWSQLEGLSLQWVERVSGPDLPEAQALQVLLASLEAALRRQIAPPVAEPDTDDPPPLST